MKHIDPITYGELVRELLKLQDKWLVGEDWEKRGIKQGVFEDGHDEGQWKAAIQLRKLIEKTGFGGDDGQSDN